MSSSFRERKLARIKRRENDGKLEGLSISNCGYAYDMDVWGELDKDGKFKNYAFCSESTSNRGKIQVDPEKKECLNSECKFFQSCERP